MALWTLWVLVLIMKDGNHLNFQSFLESTTTVHVSLNMEVYQQIDIRK